MKGIQKIIDFFERGLAELRGLARAIKDVESWDGSPARWDSTEAYCQDCLIDVNSAAGNDEKVQSFCKLPIREPGDPDSTYVRQAAHAAAGALAGARAELAKPEGVSDSDWESAVKAAATKLLSIYAEMEEDAPDSLYEAAGENPPERAVAMTDIFWSVLEQAWEIDEWAAVIDLYTDQADSIYAVIASEGKLYRAEITVSDDLISLSADWQPVTMKTQFVPVEQNRAFIIRQTTEGYRWFGVSCSAVLNRSGQIDSRDLFDSFIQHAEETGEYPIRQFFHSGEQFRTGQCDFMARDEYLLITSGLYDDTEIARAEIAARQKDPGYWGDSIGFFADEAEMIEFADGIAIPVYKVGICEEISTLPEASAAAWLTNNTSLQEVKRMLGQTQFEALVKLFNEDEDAARKWLEDNVDPANRAIVEKDLLRRSVENLEDETEPVEDETEPVEDETPETEPIEAATESIIEIDEGTFTAIVDRVATGEWGQGIVTRLDQLAESIASLTESIGQMRDDQGVMNARTANRLKNLETAEDEKRRQYLADVPRRSKIRVTHRPRDPENDEGDETPESNYQDVALSTLEKFPTK